MVTANTMNPICIGSASAGAKSDSVTYFSFCFTDQLKKVGTAMSKHCESPSACYAGGGWVQSGGKEKRRQ